LIFNFLHFEQVTLRRVVFFSEVRKMAKKNVATCLEKVTNLWVIHYIYRPTQFVHNMGLMGITRCRILSRFQKYKLQKCTIQKLFRSNRTFCEKKASAKITRLSEITFYGAF
jgi:hypothetical protein